MTMSAINPFGKKAAFQLEKGSVELPISMSEYPNGLYLVRLLLQDGSTITAKLAVH